MDRTSVFFDQFLEKGVAVAFDKLMNDEAMKEWKFDIHVGVYGDALFMSTEFEDALMYSGFRKLTLLSDHK